MSIVTIGELQTRANEVLNETDAGENTHTRIGQLLRDMVDTLNDLIENVEPPISLTENNILVGNSDGEAEEHTLKYEGQDVLDNEGNMTLQESSASLNGILSAVNFSTFSGKQEKPKPRVLGTVKFDFPETYGNIAAPVSTTPLDLNVSNAVIGNKSICFHQAGSEPSYGSGVIKDVQSEAYDNAKVNILEFTYIGDSKAILKITQTV